MIGFELQVIGLELQRNVTVAEVVRGTGQVEARTVLSAMRHDEHGLRRSLHRNQRSVFGDQHIAAAHHGAARQEHAECAALGVGGVETTFLSHIPVQRHGCGTVEQHAAESATLGDELVDGQHGNEALRAQQTTGHESGTSDDPWDAEQK